VADNPPISGRDNVITKERHIFIATSRTLGSSVAVALCELLFFKYQSVVTAIGFASFSITHKMLSLPLLAISLFCRFSLAALPPGAVAPNPASPCNSYLVFSCPNQPGCCAGGSCCAGGCCGLNQFCVNFGTSNEACCPLSDPSGCGSYATVSLSKVRRHCFDTCLGNCKHCSADLWY
jgi:hypothetical protein